MDYSSISIKHKIIHINIGVKVEEIKSTHTFFLYIQYFYNHFWHNFTACFCHNMIKNFYKLNN
jgi:hypothetical protein